MLNNQQNKRYSKADNNKNNITINNQTTSNINTLSKEPKREPLASVPMVNNIGDENSFFNAIIHMLYFTSEIYEYLSLSIPGSNFLFRYLGVANLAEATLCLLLNCIASPISLGLLNILTYL